MGLGVCFSFDWLLSKYGCLPSGVRSMFRRCCAREFCNLFSKYKPLQNSTFSRSRKRKMTFLGFDFLRYFILTSHIGNNQWMTISASLAELVSHELDENSKIGCLSTEPRHRINFRSWKHFTFIYCCEQLRYHQLRLNIHAVSKY